MEVKDKIEYLKKIESDLLKVSGEYSFEQDPEIVKQRIEMQEGLKLLEREFKIKLGEKVLEE